MITVGSLFAGIGGLELGLERTGGFKTVWQVENNPYAIRVLEKHWPKVHRWDDVKTFPPKGGDMRVELICGGFPCQDISNAGKRAGIDGERSGLWAEFARIIGVLRPRFVLVENVSALLIRGIDRVLGDLATLGYDAEWESIPAAAVGAPHIRERVFILGMDRNASGPGNDPQRRILGGSDSWAQRICDSISDTEYGGISERRGIEDAPEDCESGGISRDDGEGSEEQKEKVFPNAIRPISQSGTRGRRIREGGASIDGGQWATEPNVGGSPDGFPVWLERHIGKGMSYEESQRAIEKLRKLWNRNAAESVWGTIGGLDRISQAEILFAFVRKYENDIDQARLLLASPQAFEKCVRIMRGETEAPGPPHRPGHHQQPTGKHPDPLQVVPRLSSFDGKAAWPQYGWEDGIPRVASKVPSRVDRLRCLGNAVVPQVAELIGRMILDSY